jgi:hypothetical protein
MSRLIEESLNLSQISQKEAKRTEIVMSSLAASVVASLREVEPDRKIDVSHPEEGTGLCLSRPATHDVILSFLTAYFPPHLTPGTDNC